MGCFEKSEEKQIANTNISLFFNNGQLINRFLSLSLIQIWKEIVSKIVSLCKYRSKRLEMVLKN